MNADDSSVRHPITTAFKRPMSRLDLGLFICILLAALLLRIIPEPRTVDDAFITFRYSRNIVDGLGFVYNPGSKVLGTTTPLYTLLMAGLGASLGDNYPWYALIVNALADTLSVFLLILIGQLLSGSRRAGLLVGALWAIAPFSVTFAIGGMETSLHNLWMLSAWAAYLDRRRGGWVGAFVALGLLTRPDALIWAFPLLLHQLWSSWRNRPVQIPHSVSDYATSTTPPLASNPPLPHVWGRLGGGFSWLHWRDYLAGLVLGLPWLLFATSYFGSPFPHTVGTKALVYKVTSSQALIRLLQHYSTPLHQHEILGAVVGVLIGLFLFPALSLIGIRAATKQTSAALPILIYPWLYFGLFTILNPLIFRWYLTPPLPAYLLAIICGANAFLASFRPYLAHRRLQSLTIGLSLLAIFFMFTGWELHPDHGPNRPAPKMAFNELELNYARLSKRLVAEQGVNPDTLIAAGDIGAVGFYTNARILDTIGLVTRDLERYYSPTLQQQIIVDGANYAIPPAMIFDYQPEFIIVMQDFITLGLQQDPRFAAQYTELYRIKTDYYGDAMLVFKRQEPAIHIIG